METAGRDEMLDIAQLVELTSDAVAVCAKDGTINHVNARLKELIGEERTDVIGSDIKDLLFSAAFERASEHRLPFPLDGTAVSLMLKLSDGSFVPVQARAIELGGRNDEARRRLIKLKRLSSRDRVLVVVKSLEEQYAHDRQMRRVLSELQAANKRLSGTLSVIMATVGAEDLPSLVHAVLNRLLDALDADGSTLYFTESGGFKLRGISDGLERDYVPEFIPYGAGIPTYVLRAARACRFSVVRAGESALADEGSFYDLDRRVSRPLRVQDMPPFKTVIAVPVFFGRQVLGIIELGWKRPTMPRPYDVNVLEVICDYLSIELVSLATSMRSQRSAELTRSLNHVRDTLYTFEDDRGLAWGEIASEIRRVLSCHICPLLFDAERGCYVIDFEGGSRVAMPGDIERMFFSTTAPAARVNETMQDYFSRRDGAAVFDEGELQFARLTRIDQLSWAGTWLMSRGLPNQGVFFDFSGGVLGEHGEPHRPAAEDGALMSRAAASQAGPPPMMLLLRDSTQEPIDDIEYDYLVRLVHDFELFAQSVSQKHEDRHIAQALQSGMKSSLGSVPGITADSLYSSATRQALVGGDFYTLIRLPDDQAVMILGDVSGKGIEAASMSAFVKTALSAYAWEGTSPVQMVRSLNSMLMGFSRVETFATMFVAKIDLRHRIASYCSAGHPPSMLVRKTALGQAGPAASAAGDGAPGADAIETNEVELLSRQSGVVGAFEGMAFESGSFAFSPGDVLFMYTDGAIEARSPAGEFFGEQRLRDLLLSVVDDGVEGLCQRVLDALDAFTASALEDDIALVALRFDEGGAC